MINLEQQLKLAAERLDAAIKRELELRKQRKPQGNPEDDKFKADYEAAKAKPQQCMSHTPTPWSDQHKYLGANLSLLSKVDYARAKACVNACEGMKDPAKEIAALKARVKELGNPKEKDYFDYLEDKDNEYRNG